MADEVAGPQDKNQIGVTPLGREVLEKLKGTHFASEKAAFQAAVSLALELGLEPSNESRYDTKWGLGTMSEVLDFLQWYVGTDTPARYAEKLGEAGLSYISSRIELGRSVSEIFDSSSRPTSS
jgi:hypothetical protein